MKNSSLFIHEMSGKAGDEGRVVANVLLVYLSTFHPTLLAPGSLSPFHLPQDNCYYVMWEQFRIFSDTPSLLTTLSTEALIIWTVLVNMDFSFFNLKITACLCIQIKFTIFFSFRSWAQHWHSLKRNNSFIVFIQLELNLPSWETDQNFYPCAQWKKPESGQSEDMQCNSYTAMTL